VIGLDSNVVLRYLLDDDPKWSPVATAILDEQLSSEEPGYICEVVLAEVVWSLRSRAKYSREQIIAVIDGLLSSDSIVVGSRGAVTDALIHYRAGQAGFADYFIAVLNRDAGAAPTLTVDGDAGKHALFRPLQR
jgi:predicted nucleic-acid-binding protein